MNGTTLEITLATKEYCEFAIANPIEVQNTMFHADPAVHPDRALLRVNLTKLPIWNWDELSNCLMNNLSRYGIVREMVIYLDDWSGTWFTGNGHVYIERPLQSGKVYETLNYKISLEGESTFCLGTWTNMGKDCIYCKQTGHHRKECTEATEERHKCYQCGNSGHIARNCFRTKTDNTSSNKRRRTPLHQAQPDAIIPETHHTYGTDSNEKGPAESIERTTIADDFDTRHNDENEANHNHVVRDDNEAVTNEKHLGRNEYTSSVTPSSRPKRITAGSNPLLKDFIVSNKIKACHCSGTDHQRTTSNNCPLNKKNQQTESDQSPDFPTAEYNNVHKEIGDPDEENAMVED